MYNYPLNYLLRNEPERVLSKKGWQIRKSVNILFRNIMIPLSTKNKLIIERKADFPKNRPVIFAATHGFRDDIASTIKTTGVHSYVLFGSLPAFYESLEGYALWLNGVIMVDRKDKNSRAAAKDKMIYALSLGANILIFPEGVWNKTENLIVQKLFPGIYDVAKASGAMVVPIASIESNGAVYTILDKAFDICAYSRTDGLTILRDKMATAKYELMEKYARCSRSEIGNAQQYWDTFLKRLIATAHGHYDEEIETTAHFQDKTITTPDEAFNHLQVVQPTIKNAFLFRKRV